MAVRRPIQALPALPASGTDRSEFGRQIAVDLEADADFDEDRGVPGHGRIPQLPADSMPPWVE
jgi:hypothetical protein